MNAAQALLTMFIIIIAAILCAVMFFPMGYLYATYENLYGEWLQFSAFVGISVFSFLLFKYQAIKQSWCWLLLAVAAFYVAGEEISWGQQVFGWGSSAFFIERNLQGETNLHNMFTGPYSTVLKAGLTYVLAAGIFLYGVAYPVLLHFKIALAQWVSRIGVPAPLLYLSPVFALAAVLELALFHFNETEVAELLIALAMCFVAASAYYQRGEETTINDRLLIRKYLLLITLLIVSAVALTQISIYSASSKDRVANRIEAGIKKFAGRYARVDAWQHSINLYQRHLAYEPENRSRLRRLAGAYQSAGQTANYEQTIQRALALDLVQLETERWRASLHRSLHKTYLELRQYEQADMHIGRALEINEARLAENPNSASAFYSFALTLDLAGYKDDAIEQYQRAVELRPNSKKYRKAYREAVN